jgi:hypothetical protein
MLANKAHSRKEDYASLFLEPVGENGKQEMTGQMMRRLLLEHALPARPQVMEIEIA